VRISFADGALANIIEVRNRAGADHERPEPGRGPHLCLETGLRCPRCDFQIPAAAPPPIPRGEGPDRSRA
jgi:hypothetical protein